MSTVDEVKARLDIIDVVSETVTLKKSGRNFIGFCPFHSNTKTPSFVVFSETQTWRCFGACAEGGDIFSFVMKREGYGFKETLEALAERAGIQLDPAPQKADQDKELEKLSDLNAAAAAYFHNLLTNSVAGATARAYLATRELTSETIATFQLGYALDEWDALKKHFLERGYSEPALLAAGLIIDREEGSPGYDRFRHRLMIPIRNLRGRVIGFGARALAEDQVPKYLNSPQTKLFDKSAVLYGLDLARKHIRQADQVVIVEGYMDVIQAFQRGARNLVAQMGTALTEQQLKTLRRITNNFVLALDSDAAGKAATLRGLNVAREALDRETVPVPTARGLIRYEGRLNANIRLASLPPGKDPDDILKEGLDAWQAIIDNSIPIVDFYFQAVTAKIDLDTAKGKSAAVRELIPILRDISNQVERAHYLQKLARLIHVDERTLMAELKSSHTSRQGKRQPLKEAKIESIPQPGLPPENVVTSQAAGPATDTPSSKLELYCLSLILANPSALAVANETLEKQNVPGLGVNDFKRGDHKEIFKSLQLWTVSQTPRLEILAEMVGEALSPQVEDLASQWHNRPSTSLENIDRDLSIAILRLRLQNVNEQINELTFLQQETVVKGLESVRSYTETVERYKQQRKQLEHIRDALSLVGKRRLEANQFGAI